jgi:hypothetical protein
MNTDVVSVTHLLYFPVLSMSEMNPSRVSVALSQQEYTTPPASNSRVLGSIKLEDNDNARTKP